MDFKTACCAEYRTSYEKANHADKVRLSDTKQHQSQLFLMENSQLLRCAIMYKKSVRIIKGYDINCGSHKDAQREHYEDRVVHPDHAVLPSHV